MKIFDEARGYIKDKRFEIIGPTMIDVGHNNVNLQTRSGGSLLTCSCSNCGRFGNSHLCSSKIVWVGINLNKDLYKEIDSAITQAKVWKDLNFKISPQLIIDMLEKIKRAE